TEVFPVYLAAKREQFAHFDVHASTVHHGEAVGASRPLSRDRPAEASPSEQRMYEWVHNAGMVQVNHRTAGICVDMGVGSSDGLEDATEITSHSKPLVYIPSHRSLPAICVNINASTEDIIQTQILIATEHLRLGRVLRHQRKREKAQKNN